MELNKRDVIWSAKEGGSRGIPYHIWFDEYSEVGGCWCPPEAIDFFKSIGIIVYKTGTYNSGFAAPGCWWENGEKLLSKDVARVFEKFKHGVTNRSALHLLIKR
jgi:hypothetical protein